MKKIVTYFNVLPRGKNYMHPVISGEFMKETATMVEALGHPVACSHYGCVSCSPHQGLEITITPGPKGMVAVQVSRRGKVLLIGTGVINRVDSIVYGHTVEVMSVSSFYMPQWHHYTFRWANVTDRTFRRRCREITSNQKS